VEGFGVTDHSEGFRDEQLERARRVARLLTLRLIRMHSAFRSADPDEIVQELLLAFAAGRDRFNPDRASLNTFIDRMLGNRCRSLIRRHTAACRDWKRSGPPLDGARWDDDRSSPFQHTAADGRRHTGCDSPDELEVARLRMDLQTLLESVTDRHREYADLRMRGFSHGEARQQLGGGRREVDRLRAELLLLFEDRNLRDYL